MQDPIYIASIYRVTGVLFWESAKALNAGIELDDRGVPAKLTALPMYFLASHAAELFLKSTLLKRGFSEQDLRRFSYRHNLAKLLEALLERGVTVTPLAAGLVQQLSAQHETHALRYSALVDDGRPTCMPPPASVFEMLEELLMLTRISTQGV
jgi:hypothetical protein